MTNELQYDYKFLTVTIKPENRLEHYYWEWCYYSEQIHDIIDNAEAVRIYPELHKDHHLHFHVMAKYNVINRWAWNRIINKLRRIGFVKVDTPRNYAAVNAYVQKDLSYMEEQLGCELPSVKIYFDYYGLSDDEKDYVKLRKKITV